MSNALFDVVGLGNAIVDIISSVDDLTVHRLGMTKSAMMLIDGQRSAYLRNFMPSCMQSSGGSAANTIVGLATLGASVGYIGKAGGDVLGEVFRQDLAAINVHYATPPASNGSLTSHSLIFVTPDAQRTMNTYLGASVDLSVKDIDRNMVERAAILYLEGYLFDAPNAGEASRVAAELSHAAGRSVALSLSDAFCVQRHREALLQFINENVDILFSNEAEASALVGGKPLDHAINLLADKVEIAAITKGAAGSIIISRGRSITIPAATITGVIDTTGAGDLYAAGFLFGLVNHRSPEECGWIGSLAAGDVISRFGGKPSGSLKDYVARRWCEMPISTRYAQIQRSR